jgi:hypothetical protein
LYDLSQDIGETNNVEAQHPEIVARLTKLLEKYIAEGRSTPGKPQPNTGPVLLYPKPRNSPAKVNSKADGGKAPPPMAIIPDALIYPWHILQPESGTFGGFVMAQPVSLKSDCTA